MPHPPGGGRSVAATFATLGFAYGVWYSYSVFLVALQTMNAVGGSLGPWVAGHVFDATGSYRGAFVLAVAAAVLATAALWVAAPRRRRAG